MASLRKELEELRSRMDNLGTDLVVHGEAAGSLEEHVGEGGGAGEGGGGEGGDQQSAGGEGA